MPNFRMSSDMLDFSKANLQKLTYEYKTYGQKILFFQFAKANVMVTWYILAC